MTLKSEMYVEFADRLKIAMSANAIKQSPTALANQFNLSFDGRAVTPHTARNWLLGRAMPTQDKLMCLATLLGTTAEQLRFGRHSEKTLMISNHDGTETELTAIQQQLVRKYIKLSTSQQKLVSDLVDEISG